MKEDRGPSGNLMFDAAPEPLTMVPAHYTDPDWRWHRAKHLLDTGEPMSKVVDDDLVALCRWILRGLRSGDPKFMKRFKRKFPHIFVAYDIYRNDALKLKWMLESLLVSDATAEQIGNLCALNPVVPAAYENIFYDVRRYLRIPGFYERHVLGPVLKRPSFHQCDEACSKEVAFHLTWRHLVYYTVPLPFPPQDIKNELDQFVIDQYKKRVASETLAGRKVPPEAHRAMRHFVELKRLLDLEREGREPEDEKGLRRPRLLPSGRFDNGPATPMEASPWR